MTKELKFNELDIDTLDEVSGGNPFGLFPFSHRELVRMHIPLNAMLQSGLESNTVFRPVHF